MIDGSIIPKTLRDLDHWVVWKKEKRNGKCTKLPYDAKFPNDPTYAKSNDSSTWVSFETAVKAADPLTGGDFDGVGFMLQGSSFIGIDFDGVVDDGIPEPYVLNIIKQLGNPYCEVSPSHTGLHVFVDCPTLPPGNRKFNAKKKGTEKYGAEIYSGHEKGRYLTCTGNRFSGEGIPKVDNVELLYFLVSKFPDEHFKKLWIGDASEYENDDSRVDLALLGCLVRALGPDKEKIVRFFNASVPGHREKWKNRADYREMTLTKAFNGTAMTEKSFRKMVEEERKVIEFRLPPFDQGTSYDYVVQALPGQFDGWFPLGSPSLIGGSSGSGKTTFMLDLCVRQAIKASFYGHETYGRPYLVLMMDRGKASHERTMRRLGFVMNQVPIKFLKAVVDGDASQEIINQIESDPDHIPQIVFVEGMDMLVSDPNALEVVMPFMHEMQQIATHFHIAIVGSVGAPKTKLKEGYTAKRDTIFGSAVWSRMSETIVTMQYPGGDDTAKQREVSILPRNAKAEKFLTEFQNGKLAVVPETTIKNQSTKEDGIQERARLFILDALRDGPKLGTRVMDSAYEMTGIQKRMMMDVSADLATKGVITKRNVGGKWIWTSVPINATKTEQENSTSDQKTMEYVSQETQNA